jgi:hypothetical protein
VSITKDHNAIQDTLVRAFNTSASITVRINQAVPFFYGSLQLDIIAINENCKTATIRDFTMSFENRYAAFQDAREAKEICPPPPAEQ